MTCDGSTGNHRAPWTWSDLAPGQFVTVVKLAPDGTEAARYAGEVVATYDPGSWVIVQAIWTYRSVELDGLSFEPDDLLLEWFSPEQDFNAFAVFTPDRQLRGWYANVTLPSYLEDTTTHERPVLVWHDLYLDLIGLPGDGAVLRDGDELEASPLRESDPILYRRIWSIGDDLQRSFAHNQAPFLPEDTLAAMLRAPKQNTARQ